LELEFGIDIELGNKLRGKDGREVVDMRLTLVGCCGSWIFIGMLVVPVVLLMYCTVGCSGTVGRDTVTICKKKMFSILILCF
jgi:hypothetical protein